MVMLWCAYECGVHINVVVLTTTDDPKQGHDSDTCRTDMLASHLTFLDVDTNDSILTAPTCSSLVPPSLYTTLDRIKRP